MRIVVMRFHVLVTLASLAMAPVLAWSKDGHGQSMQRRTHHVSLADQLRARDPTGNFNQLFSASNYQNGSVAPYTTSNDAPGQTVVVGGNGGGINDDSNRVGCNTIFISTADVGGGYTTGWTSTPNVVGFYVDRNLTYGSATMPVYVEANKDLTKVKRVVIGQPGLPRDAWKYSNLFRNSLNCAVGNSSTSVQWNDVLIVAPIWLTQLDLQAGAGQATDLYYTSAGWSVGSKAVGPGEASASSFKVLDDLITRFADQSEFPAVTSIIVAGHSLGGSLTQRYAMARNSDPKTDALVQWWVGNPGAYVWPSSSRPIQPTDTSCANDVNDWPYGVGGGLPAYVQGNPSADSLYAQYRTRTIQYALGLIDDEAGDTHCEAQYQGSTHLTRGQNMQAALEAMSGGMPTTQSFNYVPDVGHWDGRMIEDPNSQEYLFVTGLDATRAATSNSNSAATSSSGKSGSSKSNGSTNNDAGNASANNSNGASATLGVVHAWQAMLVMLACSLSANLFL